MAGSRKRLSKVVKQAWADTKAMAGKLLVPKADSNSPESGAWKARVGRRRGGGGGRQGAGGGVRRFDGSGGGVGNYGTSRQPRRRR